MKVTELTRQGNRFIVLMDNYNRMLEIQEEAYKSAGTTQEQYLKFQESIDGKLGELKVTFEEFYDSLMDEEELGGAIDGLIKLGEALTWVSEKAGGLNGILKALLPPLKALSDIGDVDWEQYEGFSRADQIVGNQKAIKESTTALYEEYLKARDATVELNQKHGLLLQEYYDFRKATDDLVNSNNELAPSQEKLNYTIEDTFANMSQLADQYNAVNAGEKISTENIYKLMQQYPEYSAAIMNINDSKDSGKKLTELLFKVEKQRAINVLVQQREELRGKNALLSVEKERLRILAVYGEIDWSEYYALDTFDDEILDIGKAINLISKSTIDSFGGIDKTVTKTTKSLENLSSAMRSTTQLVIEALQDQQEARKEALEEEIDGIEEAVERVEDAEREKAELKYKYAKEGLDRQKALLRKEFNEAKYQNERQEKLEERSALQKKLTLQLSEKDRYDIQERISDLTKDLEESQTEYILDKKIEALEEEERNLETQHESEMRAIEEKTNKAVESAKIEVKWQGVLTQMTVAESRKRLQASKANLDSLNNSVRNWAVEAENIMKGSSNTVFNFLKNNLAKFSEYTKAMSSELAKTLSSVTGAKFTGGDSVASEYAISSDTASASSTERLGAHGRAQVAREKLLAMDGMEDFVKGISMQNAQGAKDFFDFAISGNSAFSSEAIALFKQIVDAKSEWESSKMTGTTGSSLGSVNTLSASSGNLMKNIMPSAMANMPNITPQISGGDVNIKVEMNNVTLGSEMDLDKTAIGIGERVSTLSQVRGIGSQRVFNGRR